MTYETTRQIVRRAHAEGCLDVLRALLGVADLHPDHSCEAVDWARRMWQDPLVWQEFVEAAQEARER